MKCADADHNYQKFDDATVVCSKCADQRVVDLAALIKMLPTPTYLPCPHPHYPVHPWQPVPIWYPVWYSGTQTISAGLDFTSTTTITNDGVTTYTVQ